jgi:quinol-cytochrome oxidoreductase complex cytochrome b subunit/cytochrome c2
MFAKLRDWLDDRTGYRKLISALLIEHIPGGAKWRYVWGSCLAFVFTVQVITGILLMTAYSPGNSTAWGSVWFIQYQMDFGWLIRGLHHFGSQMMVVLLGVHMLQVVIAGAHLPPREINWWLGLLLLALVLGMSLTGYLLPWDQKGYWATQVATNIAGGMPVAGPWLKKVIVGGPEYGHQTLTHFYALHVGILPPLIVVLMIAHVAVFRKHGVTHPANPKGEGWFWPDQAFKDMAASMVIFAIMLGLVLYGFGHRLESGPVHGSFYEQWAHAGQFGKGANLDAPADPSMPYPARPEWYFLFLFQTLKYFQGPFVLVGTLVIPMLVGLVLFVTPLLGRGKRRRFGHVFGIGFVVFLLASTAFLTYQALAEDAANAAFKEEVAKAEVRADRAVNLAVAGIPEGGGVYLLRRDPLTQGPHLFKEKCASCHTYAGLFENPSATASDLAGWGTKEWIMGLLHDPSDPHFFGRTKHTGMINYVKRKQKEDSGKWPEIAEWLGGHPRGEIPNNPNAQGAFAQGARVFYETCCGCHSNKGEGAGTAPDMMGYGDAEWLRMMLVRPYHKSRYGTKNAMPAFFDKGEGMAGRLLEEALNQFREAELADLPEDPKKAKAKQEQIDAATKAIPLSDVDRELIIRWLLKDDRVVFGGQPISGPPKRD